VLRKLSGEGATEDTSSIRDVRSWPPWRNTLDVPHDAAATTTAMAAMARSADRVKRTTTRRPSLVDIVDRANMLTFTDELPALHTARIRIGDEAHEPDAVAVHLNREKPIVVTPVASQV
jgi:hypothetical protein